MDEPNPDLPLDIISDILLRLPIKSICRFRCVSKSHKSLLTSRRFIKDHLKLHMNDPEDYIFTVGSTKSCPSTKYILTFTPGSAGDGVLKKVNLEEGRAVMNSCHGLVLFTDQTRDCSIFLMNPITLEVMQVPKGPYSTCDSALGYNSSGDDYKIVTIGMVDKFVDIYSLKTKIWRRIGDFSYSLQVSNHQYVVTPGVFMNGCLHWIAYHRKPIGTPRPVILSFRLANEEFEELTCPSLVQYGDGDPLYVRCLDGCLVVVHCSCRGSIDVWTMKEYVVCDSWTKPITIDCAEYLGDGEFAVVVVCLLVEDEIILEVKEQLTTKQLTKLVAYNRKNRVWRDLAVTAGIDSNHLLKLRPFRGSLVSPN